MVQNWKKSIILSYTILIRKIEKNDDFKLLMPGDNKRSHILKQTCSFQLKVYLSICDLFVTTRH